MMLWSCAFRTENLAILVLCVGLLSANDIDSFSFHKFFDITQVLGCLENPYMVESNMSSIVYVWISWGYVGSIGCFGNLKNLYTFVESDMSNPVRLLRVGAYHLSQLILTVNDFFVVIQNTLLPCARVVGSLKLEAWDLKIVSTKAMAHHIVQSVHMKFD